MTRNGALAGMLVGALTVIIWKQFGWLGLYEIIPASCFATLAIVLFSLLDKAPPRPCRIASQKPSRSSRAPWQTPSRQNNPPPRRQKPPLRQCCSLKRSRICDLPENGSLISSPPWVSMAWGVFL